MQNLTKEISSSGHINKRKAKKKSGYEFTRIWWTVGSPQPLDSCPFYVEAGPVHDILLTSHTTYRHIGRSFF